MRTRRAAAPPPLPPVDASTAAASPPPLSDTQRRILDAALGLFAERGFEGVSTAEIAARAEVAEKTLFANFGSKQRLYEATIGPAGLKLVLFPEAMRTLLPLLEHPPEGPSGLLRALVANRLAFLREHHREARLMMQHLLRRPESSQAFVELWTDRVRPVATVLLESLSRAGQLRADLPPELVVRMVMAQILGYALSRVLLRPDLPWDDEREDEQEIDLLVDALLHGLAPRKPATRRRSPR